MDFDNSANPGRFFTSLVRELKSLAISNIQYFKDGKLSHHAKFHVAFCLLFEYLDLGIEPCFREISQRVHEFDVSATEKGNGYRSLLRIVQKCCLHLLQICRHISTSKESMLFRRAFYMKELEAYVATLGQLRACLYYAQKLMAYCQAGCLFADEETLDDALAEQLMTDVEMLSQDCFYGRCLGFQFCESMQRPLSLVAIAMASFSEGYQEKSQLMRVATSIFNSGKYIMNPDLRAQQVVNVTRTADIQFCKAFWSITETELMHQLPSMVCPSVQVDQVFQLGPDAFDMPSTDGADDVTITPPCAHTGPAPVQVRLISAHLRVGQEQHMKASKSPTSRSSPAKMGRSKALLVHCHGGGFVAQSSRSHEVYLRHWAQDLDVPILSIDYSLAPESPFPRALEECFYVYAWAVHNCHKLGSTGEVIVLAGDSAGANLIIATAMRAASFNIRRPDGILGVYTPVLVRYTPSPARLLSLMDPLLPAGILSRCLAAYAGVSDELSSQLATSVSCHIESSAATLRLSSQDASDPDWVVVSQDAAANTTSTLPQPRSSVARQRSEEDDDKMDGEEVEIFSKPRTAGGVFSSMVSGATGRLSSYVGTLGRSLVSSGSQASARNEGETKEEEPVVNFSLEAELSPATPSFHTPSATPTGPLARIGEAQEEEKDEEERMVEIDLKEEDLPHLRPAPEDSGMSSDSAASVRSDQVDPFTLPPGGEASLGNFDSHHFSLPESSSGFNPDSFDGVTPAEGKAGDEDRDGPQSCMPSLAQDKAELLQVELDNSLASTTLPSSLLSSPSDELNSYEILDSGPDALSLSPSSEKGEVDPDPDRLCLPPTDTVADSVAGDGREGDSHSDALSLSPTTNKKGAASKNEGASASAKEAQTNACSPSENPSLAETTGISPSEEEAQSAEDRDSSPSLSFTSAAERQPAEIEGEGCGGKDAGGVGEKCTTGDEEKRIGSEIRRGEGMEGVSREEGDSAIGRRSSSEHSHLSFSAASPGPRSHSASAMVTESRTSKGHTPPSRSGCPPDQLGTPSPPLLAELGRPQSSEMPPAAASTATGERSRPDFEGERSGPSLNRASLHLNLQRTTSGSLGMPRSVSHPLLGDRLSVRSSHSMSPSDFKRERHLAQSPLKAIRNIPIVKNPYMSPLLAPEWLLQGLPHICLVACHLDPLLDDSVMFTRRLRSLGKTVDLLLLDDLPHGFLNFSLVSRDAKQGSDLCVGKLRQLLQLGEAQVTPPPREPSGIV